jgi:hypothetical protein
MAASPYPSLPTEHQPLTLIGEGTPKNFALRKGGTKIRGQKNADPICKSISYTD